MICTCLIWGSEFIIPPNHAAALLDFLRVIAAAVFVSHRLPEAIKAATDGRVRFPAGVIFRAGCFVRRLPEPDNKTLASSVRCWILFPSRGR